jgi:WD40 repeat protein
VLFTPDGSKLFTAGDEGNLCVFDCDQNFLPIKYLATALPSNHAAMAIAPNGALLASLGVDASFVLLFDAVTLAPHSRMDLADATIANLAFSPNSEQLLVTTTDLRLERYDIATGRYLAGAGCVHQTSCDTLVLDSSGSFVFTGGHDKLLKVWPFHLERHPSKPPPSQSFCGHSDAVSTIALDEARRQVITTGPGNTVYVWRFDGVPEGAGLSGSDGDVESAEVPRAVPPTPSARAALQAAAESEPASPDAAVQKEEASSEHASPDATVQKAEASSEPSEEAPSAPMLRKMMMVGYTGFDQGHDNIAWDPTAGVLAYPIHTAVMMEELNTRQQRHLSGHTAPVTCLAISAAAGLLASGDAGGSIIMWLLATGDMVGTLDITGAITSLSFNPTGRHLACFSGGSEPMAAVWAVQNTEAVATAPTAQAVRGVAWRPGSALTEFITVGATELVVWTLEESSATDPMLASHTIQLPVPADDPGYAYTTLAVLDHTTVVVGDTAGGLWRVDVQVGAIEWHLGASIAAATDGPVQTLWARKAGKMVTGGGSSLKIWVERVPGAHEDAGAQPWLEAWDVQLDGGVVACVLDDMGDEGIAATTSGTIWFLNLSEHGAMPLMGGHPTTVTGVCVSDTAELMATACADGVLRVWETERFAKQMQFEMPGAACTAVALSPGAAQAAVGYSSGALCIYDLDHIAVVGDCAAHHAPVVGVVFPFVHEPKCVLSGSADGHLVVTDAVGMSTVATSDALTCYSWPMEALLALPDHHMSSDTTRRVLAVWADRLEVFELTLAGSYLEVVPVGRSLQLTGGGGDGGKTVVALATSQPYIALFTSPATQVLLAPLSWLRVIRASRFE